MENNKTFLFGTTATVKEYNRGKWWIDSDIIPQKTFTAENARQAIEKYIKFCNDNGVIISKTAAKNAENMYSDGKDGKPQKRGKVFTAKYEIYDDEKREYKNIYIELWADIVMISYDF